MTVYRNACLNKNVLRDLLKAETLSDDLIDSGKMFHFLGAIIEKALSPKCLSRAGGSVRRFLEEDRKFRIGIYGVSKEQRYGGARPCSALKHKRRILKSILYFTGSQ